MTNAKHDQVATLIARLLVPLVLACLPHAAAAQDAEPRDPNVSIFADPLGFALFGPRIGVEAGHGHFSGVLSARWLNAGALSKALFLGDGDAFRFSYGGGVGARYYLTSRLIGVHAGVAAEVLRSRIENQADGIMTTSSYLVPYAEGGYRLRFQGFYADASAGLGYALRLSGQVSDLPGRHAAAGFEAKNESSFYGTLSLDVGLLF